MFILINGSLGVGKSSVSEGLPRMLHLSRCKHTSIAMLIDELLTYLFDGQAHPLTTSMGTWLASSRRFTTFVSTSGNKIRKKLRATREQGPLDDLRLELETAYLLLRERSLSVVYEPQQCGQLRCPDFAVTFTTSLTFRVEVTRMQATEKRNSPRLQTQDRSAPETALAVPLVSERIVDTMCSKLGQMLPQSSNVLLVGVEEPCPTSSELQATLLRLQQRAERNDPKLLQRHGFRDRADFFRHYQRLSEILVRRTQLQADEPVVGWVNPQAKHPLPSRVRTALYHSHAM